MKKIILGVAIVATTLISADWEAQTNGLGYKDKSVKTSQSNMNSLSRDRVTNDGLGYEKPKRGKKPKFKIRNVYKKKCSRCHGRSGDTLVGKNYIAIASMERKNLEKILFYYAQRRYGADNQAPQKMKDTLRNLPRVQIRALAKYISEEL